MGKKLIFAAVLGLLVSAPAWANGLNETYGLGSRAMGLGGAFTAVADDYSAVFYNPAGLALSGGNSITSEYFYSSPHLDVSFTDDGADLKLYASNGNLRNDPTEYSGGGSRGMDLKAPIIGATLDVNSILKIGNQVRLGVVFSPANNKYNYGIKSFPPDQPHFIRYGDNICRLQLVAGLGVEVVPDVFYVGGGVAQYLVGDGTYHMDNMQLVDSTEAQYLVNQSEQSSFEDVAPIASVMLALLDKDLKLGLTFRDDMQVELGPMPTIITTNLGLDLGMVLDPVAMYNPEEFAFGISYDQDKYMISADLTLERWSKYRFSDTDRLYYNPANTALSPRVGRTPDFDDTLNFRLGFEYKLNSDASLLCGYAYQPTPVPDQSNRVTNYLDADTHMLSLGGSYKLKFPGFSQPAKLTGSFMYQHLDSYTVHKEGVVGKSWVNQESYKVEGQAFAGCLGLMLAW